MNSLEMKTKRNIPSDVPLDIVMTQLKGNLLDAVETNQRNLSPTIKRMGSSVPFLRISSEIPTSPSPNQHPGWWSFYTKSLVSLPAAIVFSLQNRHVNHFCKLLARQKTSRKGYDDVEFARGEQL
jgi:hypothetical protein